MKGFSVMQPTKEKHAKHMAKMFNDIMEEYSQAGKNPADVVIRGVQALQLYFESSHQMYQSEFFNIKEFIKALESTGLGAQRRTLGNRMLEGCMIEGLIQFGSTKYQACHFMKKYCGMSVSSAKIFHPVFLYEFHKEGIHKEFNKYDFVDEFCDWILEFVDNAPQIAPSDKPYPDAVSAYKNLMLLSHQAVAKKNQGAYRATRMSPYGTIDMESYTFESADDSQS